MALKQKIQFLYGATTYENYQSAINALKTVQMYIAQPVAALYKDSEEVKAVLVVGKKEGKGEDCFEVIASNSDLSSLISTVESLSGDLTNHKAQVATDSVLGHVKSGGDISVSAQGVVTVPALEEKAPINNAQLTGTPTAPTAGLHTNTTQIATTAFVVSEIADKIAAANALSFKGVLSDSVSLPTADVTVGDVYIVGNGFTGKVGTETVEVGDMVIATAATPTWAVIQKNLDGAVTSKATSATAGNIVVFDDTTGTVVKDSGKAVGDLVEKTTKVEAGAGLKGGGALSGDVTLSHQDKPTTGTKTGEDGKYISSVTVDALGHVADVETASLPTESGKVKVASTDTADYLGTKFGTATPTADNTVPVTFSTNDNKIEGTVVISEISGGTF